MALSDRQIEQIRRYVASCGRICIVGQAGTFDERLVLREQPALDELPVSGVERIEENDAVVRAVRRACDDQLSVSIRAGPGLCSELTGQSGRRLVHIVSYRTDDPVKDVLFRLRLPYGCKVKAATLVSPVRQSDLEVSFKERGGLVTFGVPQVSVYEIAVVAMEQASGNPNSPGYQPHSQSGFRRHQ